MEFVILGQACSSCYHRHGFWLVEAREVVEVAVLVEFVEHGARAVFELRSCEDRNTIMREQRSETGTSLRVFEGRDAGCELAGFEEVRMGLVERLAKLKVGCVDRIEGAVTPRLTLEWARIWFRWSEISASYELMSSKGAAKHALVKEV